MFPLGEDNQEVRRTRFAQSELRKQNTLPRSAGET